jgi:hypothetical protein
MFGSSEDEKARMSGASLLLKAYYEVLYEQLRANKKLLAARIEELLGQEIAQRGFEKIDRERYAAYRDACLAFVDERIEMYNPIGIQYTFDRAQSRQVQMLELQLNWYDSRAEFEALVQAARDKAKADMSDREMKQLAEELVAQSGAFPDKSIIYAYEVEPALNKLPDYIVGRAIEDIIHSQRLP